MQHRRVYLDDWCLLEKICLVSAVLRHGENWSSVCEFIKPRLQDNRPWDWFTAETCETQYKTLSNECVKLQINNENPVLQIIQNLKAKCKTECQRKEEQWSKYTGLKRKLETMLKDDTENETLEKYYEDVQREKKEKEESLRKYQELLKKRDSLKTEYEKLGGTSVKTPNKQESRPDGSSSPVVTSPLLSSLLNNPPAIQYRPTLSTANFIPSKSSQTTSRNTSFDKSQALSIDAAFKDSLIQDIQDQPNTSSRQMTPVFSSSSSVMKRLDFQDEVNSPQTSEHNRVPVSGESTPIKIPSTAENVSKTDSQNLENLYLPDVDIPPETLLEVIDDLKEGIISVDKIIQDLEGNDESMIMDKEIVNQVPITAVSAYATENKLIEQTGILASQTQMLPKSIQSICDNKYNADTDKVKTEVMVDEGHMSVEIEMVNDIDDSVTIVTSASDSKTDKSDFPNVFPSGRKENPQLHVTSDVDPSHSSAARSMENTAAAYGKPAVSSEPEEEGKNKHSKPIVVIKRIDDGSLHSSGRNKRAKSKIFIEDVKEEPKETPKSDEPSKPKPALERQDSEEKAKGKRSPEIVQISSTADNIPLPFKELNKHLAVTICDKINAEDGSKEDGNSASGDKKSEVYALKESNNVSADNSTKLKDTSQSQVNDISSKEEKTDEEISAQIENVQPAIENVEQYDSKETEEKSRKDEETRDERKSETQVCDENLIAVKDEYIPEESTEKENEVHRRRDIENIVLTDSVIATEDTVPSDAEQKGDETRKAPDELKPVPMKIIKKNSRKRKNTSESNDSGSEMSVTIPTLAMKEIETVDSNAEQTFTPVRNIKVEPNDSKLSTETPTQRKDESSSEKQKSSETPSTSKSRHDKAESKASDKNVVTVLRRSSIRNQTPLKKPEEIKKEADNAELMKTRKKTIMWAHSRLVAHKYSNAFQKPITNKSVPGYQNIVYKPMDLSTIKKKIENKEISTVVEFQRDVLLMLNNAKMYNRTNSQVYNMAVEVQQVALPQIQLTVDTFGEGIARHEKENNDKIRKRQSLDNAKKDSRLLKRTKYSSKEDNISNISFKKPRLEDTDDSSKSS